ncbi:MAG TPA: 4-alpha-glucanotransferase [Bryobacteraceae bacterium]|nr:4-alpha-glucanotransferase [Bryobacteraceae bacterium]
MRTPLEDLSPANSYDEALARAARAWGVQDEYWDIFGQRHVTNAGVQRSILDSMGFRPDTVESLNDAIRRRADLEWAVLVPPTLVVSLSQGWIPVNVPQHFDGQELQVAFQWEGGGDFGASHPISDLRAERELAGNLIRRRLPLPAGATLGYHRLTLRCGGTSAECRLILCPDRAYRPPFLDQGSKSAGIAISVYGLRSERNWGCGDFTDLRSFCEWAVATTGVSFIALNPLHSIPNRQPYNTSPYLPNCSFYRNALYLDVEAIPDVQASAEARRVLASAAFQRELAQLRAAAYVEYEKVFAQKLHILKFGFDSFLDRPKSAEFQAYIEAEGELLDRYAVYCALDEYLHEVDPNVWIWPDWPEEYRDPKSPQVAQFRREHAHRVVFYKWVQWQVDVQLAAAQAHARAIGLEIGLYHDLALATDRCGSDLWAYKRFYVAGCRVGSPPDDFSPSGQDWAFPPPNSLAHKLDGYRLFAQSIRKNCKHGGALRIDHVMRFFRLFWIPEGKTAAEGAYVLDYADDLLRILALESVRNEVIVIGEDLGTVEPYIRESLRSFGVLSYRLLYFEKNGAEFRRPAEYPREALVSVSTHDLPTLAGFWTGRDIDARLKAGVIPDDASFRSQMSDREREKQKMLDVFRSLGLLPEWFPRLARDIPEFTGELHYAAVGFLASTPSELMVLNQEDLFKDTDQQNLPGTTEQYPNWRHKMRYTIEELSTDPVAVGCTRMFRTWLERTGRV